MAKKKNNDTKNHKKKEKEEKGNIYDRIMKEDSDLTFEGLLEMEYGINLEGHQPLQEKIPKTLEREVDSLYKIKTKGSKDKLLHLEFQTKNNKEMVERVQEYHGLIYRKYRIPIRHIVAYYGPEKKKMISKLPEEAVFRGFELICINEIDADKFLNSDKPELVILAPLGKYKKGQEEEILDLTFKKLDDLPKYSASPSRYVHKLLMYSKLRNLDETLTEKIKTMPLFTNEMIKDHALYKEGKEEGREQEREILKEEADKKEVQAIISFHTKGIDIKIIAEAFNITQKRVKQVIADWEKRSPKK